MLIELKFEQLKPRTVPAYEADFAKALPARAALSPLAGIWRTEVGNIDQMVQLWTYRDAAHREAVLREAARLPAWSAMAPHASLMEEESKLLTPTPFSPALEPRKYGSLYELRIYDYEAERIPYVVERWQEKITARLALSPLVMCGYTTTGGVRQWVHLWAYENALERQKIRAESIRMKIWPPNATDGLIRQQNRLLIPTSFSPLG